MAIIEGLGFVTEEGEQIITIINGFAHIEILQDLYKRMVNLK